jgi:hypothetical protein
MGCASRPGDVEILSDTQEVVDDSPEETAAQEPSSIAQKLEQIKELTLAAAQRRSHLPQPLFWSLFHAQLAEVKREKKALRELEELFTTK